MNQTITHAFLKAVLATLSETDPKFIERLTPRLEEVAKRAEGSGWKEDAIQVRQLIS